jgi:uncharacterized protein (DUF885 family)
MIRKIGISMFCSLFLAACSDDQAPSGEEARPQPQTPITQPEEAKTMDFAARMQAISEHYFALRPEIATYYGVPDELAGGRISGRLGDFSVAGEERRRAGLKAILDELDALSETPLTDRQRTSLDLVATIAGNAYVPAELVPWGSVLGEYGNWFSPYAVSHLTGSQFEVPMILESKMAVRNAYDAEAYLSRLEAFPAVLDGLVEKVAYDLERGVLAPDFSLDRTIRGLEKTLAGPPVENSMVRSFSEKMARNAVDGAEEFAARAVTLLEQGVYPAYARLADKLIEVRPQASHQAGVDRLPNGAGYYRAMITHMTDTNLTPEEIHAIGLYEVERIHAEMDRLLQSIGAEQGSVGERMSRMLADPQYLYPNTAEGKAQLVEDMKADLALVDALLPQWFGKLPQQEVAIRIVPPHREQSVSGAFYDAPAMDGSRPGTYWISLYDTAATPSYSLQTLTYHEANPGHHLQTMLGLGDGLPILNTVFYSNAAGEGWGLYAEYLASEMGIYAEDPVDDLGRLQAELHRAVRLVVDTGMHAMGWSREQAIEYSVATEGIHLSEATDEIDRYAVWPGQALGYKLGMLKILELRQQARDRLGDRFDIRTFHDALLENGALPLNLMEEKIDGWIRSQLES